MEPMELAKSSLDAFIQGVAGTLMTTGAPAQPLEYVNLDSTDAQEKLDSDIDLVIAKIMEWDNAPRPPLFDLRFIVGVKVFEDTNGYRLMQLLKELQKAFPVDGQINVGDYGSSATPDFDGYMVVTRSTLTGSNFEGINLVQVLQVDCKAMIHAG